MAVYYNEFEPYAAQFIRNLIAAGHIAPGVVDERSIEDVLPSDLRGFTQCHFFAGVGVWSYALRRAGWPDDRPVWTGSCPCQPFSAAGAGAGFADERHLWPAFFHLIEQCKPATVFGEQVASKDADPWIDLVQTDLEALGYGVGAVAFPSAGVGAPHIRDRLYWMGYTGCAGLERHTRHDGAARRKGAARPAAAPSLSSGLANLHGDGCHQARPSLSSTGSDGAFGDRTSCGLANTVRGDWNKRHQLESDGRANDAQQNGLGCITRHSHPTNGFWRDADWLLCRDGKWRPVEPGTFPLAHGAPARVGRLRAYGNAINAEAAIAFIEAAICSHMTN